MWSIFVVFILEFAAALGLGEDVVGTAWTVDRNSVRTGGVVTLVIENPPRNVFEWELRIGERQPQRLLEMGPAIRQPNRMLVLLSHDLRGAVAVDSGDRDEIYVRIPPLFAEPGSVALAMEHGGTVMGVEHIEVAACPQQALRALDLLFPTIHRNGPAGQRERDSLWPNLLVHDSFGVTPRITFQQLEQLNSELPIIVSHPDWAEVMELLVARLRAREYARGVRTSQQAVAGASDTPACIAEFIREAASKELQGAYAKALQDQVRRQIAGRNASAPSESGVP